MRYEVTVTLHIEAESEEQADNRAYAIVNFGGQPMTAHEKDLVADIVRATKVRSKTGWKKV